MSYPTAMKLRVHSIWFKKFLSSCQLCVFRTADPVCRESAGHQWLPSQGTSIAGALIYSYIFALACCWMNNKAAGEYQWMDDYTMGQKGWDDIYSGYMLKKILGLDVIVFYMGNFILQIWKYLINMYTFICILLTIMFLWALAKITMFWGITLPQSIGETCQVCNKKCSLSVTLYNVKTV